MNANQPCRLGRIRVENDTWSPSARSLVFCTIYSTSAASSWFESWISAAQQHFESAVGEYVADERVGAIIGIAPFVGDLSDEQLASIDVPALVMIGTEDAGGASATRAWDLPSSKSYRVDLVGGEHLSFTDICEFVSILEANPDADAGGYRDLMYGFRPRGCEADDFPFERARDITNTFVSTFLDSVFRGAEPIRLDQVDGQDAVRFAKRNGLCCRCHGGQSPPGIGHSLGSIRHAA